MTPKSLKSNQKQKNKFKKKYRLARMEKKKKNLFKKNKKTKIKKTKFNQNLILKAYH